jgi:hypothetical protein
MAKHLGVVRGTYASWEMGHAAVPTEVAVAVRAASKYAQKMQKCLVIGGEQYRKWRGY